jgi:hypothetical protein
MSLNEMFVFSLVGLCLFIEHRFTGRQVQVAHMNLSKQSIKRPQLVPPIQAWDIMSKLQIHN